MRELKFRAWDEEMGKMYVGDFHIVTNGFYVPNNSTTGHLDKSAHFIKFGEENPRAILMQFTGLKDKNGKEIYEGDIILTDQVVTWNDESQNRGDNELFCWGIQNGKWTLETYKDREDFEVIGNIYENPDLMKDDK